LAADDPLLQSALSALADEDYDGKSHVDPTQLSPESRRDVRCISPGRL
jgi:hypothetical protein